MQSLNSHPIHSSACRYRLYFTNHVYSGIHMYSQLSPLLFDRINLCKGYSITGTLKVILHVYNDIIVFFTYWKESTETTSESVNSTCKETEVYSGEICRKPLQSCLLGNQSTGVLYIPATGKQEELELQAHQLLANLTAFQPNQDYCEDAIAQLLCLYLFCPCDWNGTLYMPSFQQCQSIRDGPCASEWTWVKVNVTLPDCESFSDSSTVGCYPTG